MTPMATVSLPMGLNTARQSLKRSADRLDAFGPIDHFGLATSDAVDPLAIEVFKKAPALCQPVTVHGLVQGDIFELKDLVNPTDQPGQYKMAARLVVFPALIPTLLSGVSLADEPMILAQPYNFLILKATWSFDGFSAMACSGPVVYVSTGDDSQGNDLSGIPAGKFSQRTWAFVIGLWDAKGVFSGTNNENQPFLPLGGF